MTVDSSRLFDAVMAMPISDAIAIGEALGLRYDENEWADATPDMFHDLRLDLINGIIDKITNHKFVIEGEN